MATNKDILEVKRTESNFCVIPTPLNFDPAEIDMKDIELEGISNMSSLFCPDPKSVENRSLSCKPDTNTIKMFVGQIPHTYTESDLLEMFAAYGRVSDLRLLRDKTTGRSKGCCFVTFVSRRSAMCAQNALHNIKVLPGMHHPVQMKPADGENRNDRKLFIGMLARKFTENDVRTLFSPYGAIEECTVLRDFDRQSKGCAFVTYLTRKSAQNAVKSMHHCHIFDGCSSPMVVKFADTQKDKEIRRMQAIQNDQSEQNTISNALQQLPLDTLTSLVASNNLIQQLQSSGYLNMNSQCSILNQLKMPAVQIPLRHAGNLRTVTNNCLMSPLTAHGGTPGLALNDAIALNNLLSHLSDTAALRHLPPGSLESTHRFPSNFSSDQAGGTCKCDNSLSRQKQIEGPDGANLFIYHLPHDFTDQDLVELFNPFGKVISAKVFVDKVTNLSKCFGFVSFDQLSCATAAIHALNGFHILGKKLKVGVKKRKLPSQT